MRPDPQLRFRSLVSLALTPALLLGASSVLATGPANPSLGLRGGKAAPLALVGARVHVAPGKVVENATLLVRDGRVEAVGADLAVPADATVVDVTGATIYPGFVEPMSEYGLTAPPKGERRGRDIQYVRSGDGDRSWNDAVRAERRAAAELAPAAEAASALRARGVTSALTVARDGIFRGRAALVSLADGSREDGPLEDLVIEADGPHVLAFDKGSSTQAYPSSQMGSIALIRQTLLDAEHLHRAGASGRRPTADLPTADLSVTSLARDLYAPATRPAVIFETSDEHALLRAAAIGRELGLPMIHVGSGFEYRRLDEIAALRSPVILPARLPKKPEVGSVDAAHDVSLGDLRHWERAAWNPAALAGKGVEIAFSAVGTGKDDNVLATVREAVRYGLDPATALAALTTVPAKIAGVADEVGSLEVGRRADFLVTSGDLFSEPTAKIRAVWIGGALVQEPTPEVLDLRGRWGLSVGDINLELEIKGDDAASAKGTARIAGETPEPGEPAPGEGDPERAEPAAASTPKPVNLEGLSVARRSGHFRLDLTTLGGAGIARIAVQPPSDTAGEALEARIQFADGRRETQVLQHLAETESPATEAAEAPAPMLSRRTIPASSAFGLEVPPTAEDVLVRGATVWTSGPAGKLENADLLVRGGTIAAVGPSLAAPAGVRVIDGAGLHVTAGLIDEHSHLAIAGGVNEGTHPVTSEVRIEDVLDPDDVGMWRALAGGTTTMQLLHGSANPIGGQAAVVKLRWGRSANEMRFAGAPPSIKFALGENVKQSNWDNPGPRYPKTRMGVDARIRDAFLAARSYRDEHAAWGRLSAREQAQQIPPRRDLQLEALAEILDDKRDIHCHSYVQSEILALLRLGDELGFQVSTLTHILEGYKVAPEIAVHGAGASSFADWWAYKVEVYDAIPHNACLLARAGVVTSINSDSAEMIRRLNQEASKSVMACDMDEVAALELVTINPARQLGIDDHVGSLEVGKDADFVIWNGHPLSTLSRVEQTWVDGAPLFTRERDQQLREAAESERQALIQKVLDTDTKSSGGKGKRSGGGPAASDIATSTIWHCDDVHDVWSKETR